MPSPPRTIIGIDPGTSVLGYAIIDIISANAIYLQSVGGSTTAKVRQSLRKTQKDFLRKVTFLLETYHPHEMAIEAPFYGGKTYNRCSN
jgi:crossover junction endodeoxyribonuclease RuvC